MNNSIDLILVNNKENSNINEEIFKALKPGGYIFSFDTPNKAHNSVCDIEDIGFIVKDSISYFFKENEDVNQDVICLAMKPLSEKTFADNVLKWGTGGLNIDKCRIGYEATPNPATNPLYRAQNGYKIPEKGQESKGAVKFTSSKNEINPEGRYPANLIIHKDVAPILDNQSGILKSGKATLGVGKNRGSHINLGGGKITSCYADEGGVSRFFKSVDSQKELLKYIAIMGLPPKKGKVLFLGFNGVEDIVNEINKEKGTSYEVVGGMN